MCDSNISAFPLHRRRKLVEGIARVLESKDGEDANAFWRNTAKAILVQLSDQELHPGWRNRKSERFFMLSWAI